jgi:hypothetical protein
MASSDTLTRLLRACATGYGSRSVISRKGLINLTREGLWYEAATAIIQLEEVHPRAQDRFLEAWLQGTWMGIHIADLDQDLVVAFLRKVLPAYIGFGAILFRGQIRGPAGMSWTRSPMIALKFAQFGTRHVDPFATLGDARPDAVVLAAIVPAANIICAPCLHRHGAGQGEYVVDPRGLEFSIEPASEAAVWIEEHMANVLERANGAASWHTA